jgi:hypothetical protein
VWADACVEGSLLQFLGSLNESRNLKDGPRDKMRFAYGHVSGEIGKRIAIGTAWILVRNVSYLGDLLDVSQHYLVEAWGVGFRNRRGLLPGLRA